MSQLGARSYNPMLGRWINRDPIGVNGGLHLYGFVENMPVGSVDHIGLWTAPAREGKARAIVKGECGDRVEQLAKGIQLNPKEFILWLKSEDGDGLPVSHTEPLKKDRIFSVPNRGYLNIGYFSARERVSPIVLWLISGAMDTHNQWSNDGLLVESRVRPVSAIEFSADMRSPDLYRYAYYGHGGYGTLLIKKDGSMMLGAQRYTRYRIPVMMLMGCQTDHQWHIWNDNVSAAGVLTTVEGIMDVVPPTPHFRWRYHRGRK